MKKVVIMRGPSGCGKSTYIKDHYPKAVVVSADNFWLVPASRAKPGSPLVDVGIAYEFDPTRLPEAHAACFTAFIKAILDGAELIVVDNTNIRIFEYRNYVLLARAFTYDVQIVELMPETVGEMREVIARNVHKVPADVVMKMVLNFEHAPAAKSEKVV